VKIFILAMATRSRKRWPAMHIRSATMRIRNMARNMTIIDGRRRVITLAPMKWAARTFARLAGAS
jgi:hypothetical protein